MSVAVLANQAMNYLATGQAPGRLGNGHPNIVPYDVYPTRDGHLILAVGNDGQFAALAALLGEPGWATDPDFASNSARVRQRHRLNALIAERLLACSSAEWSAMLEAAGVPGGPILTLDALFALEQGAVRGWVQQVQRGEQPLPTLANPLHLSATRCATGVPRRRWTGTGIACCATGSGRAEPVALGGKSRLSGGMLPPSILCSLICPGAGARGRPRYDAPRPFIC